MIARVFGKHGLPLTRDKTVLLGPFIPGDAYDTGGSVFLLTENCGMGLKTV